MPGAIQETTSEPKVPCPQTIRELVERFELHREAYTGEAYNETQVRREFIDPLFKALGWDMDNEAGHAEAYKDVIHEDAIKVGGTTKAPDYCFRIGGTRKFFVEAKKPSVQVGSDPLPAYQVRRYAWTNKLPLSIVTDFEEFAVYDCRIKPKADDRASAARVLYMRCGEYASRWHEIAEIFSKDAILKGSFDKYAERARKKRGTTEVDDEFLKEIEGWREELARNVALRNPEISARDLNFAVGKTIDRIVFLRMCEDRGVETYHSLGSLLSGSNVYKRLVEIFYRADERYNSGLFHFTPERGRPELPDTLTAELVVDDDVLKGILKRLYYPESPYEFAVMPPEILGQVYERFLGKGITLTAGHRARIEEKPEVRKAGGVYYTPKYIVDYIVEHTVGKLLEGKQPKDAGPPLDVKKRRAAPSGGAIAEEAIRILDPACGSGSFLLGAYQYLLDWHLRWYLDNDAAKWARQKNPPIYESLNGASPRASAGTAQPARALPWRLTIAEKKRILLNNIFGVDIDPYAVEVTKLSLLLKVLEGENQQTLDNQMRIFHERALPDLGANIKCGNSLVGPDFYDNQQMSFLDEEERFRINAFDWKAEFAPVMKAGGFDAVIGNPPYLFITEVPESMRTYYQKKYASISYRFDLYGAFIERSVQELLRNHGRLGFIVPHTLLSNDSFQPLRSLLAQRVSLARVVDFGPGVFRGAKNETMLLFLRLEAPSKSDYVDVIRARPRLFPRVTDQFRVAQSEWACKDGRPWTVHVSPASSLVIRKMECSRYRLADLCTANQGLRTGDNKRFLATKSKGPNCPICAVASPTLCRLPATASGCASPRFYICPTGKDCCPRSAQHCVAPEDRRHL